MAKHAVSGFAPIADANARILILGSMPSVASIQADQYYGHPRNAFWPLMGELFGAGRDLPYARRADLLLQAGVAVWDVLQSCERPGSLDSDIQKDTEIANDFPRFLRQHPQIGGLVFNGRKAEQLFAKHVRPRLSVCVQPQLNKCVQRQFRKDKPAELSLEVSLPTLSMPSTSPAMASLDFSGKLKQWRRLLDWLEFGFDLQAC